MKNEASRWIAPGIEVLAGAVGAGGLTLALAGDRQPPPPPVHYRGLINDYTPSAAVTTGGPYEMRGKWSLEVDQRHGTAQFSAEMNMETSDFGRAAWTRTIPRRGAHTHHTSMTDGMVSTDWAGCPTFSPAVTGSAVWKPFVAKALRSWGANVTFSNLTIQLGTPATKHFGVQPIHGVVVWCAGPWELESKDCTVQQ